MQDELIAARIDRLPDSGLHWRILALLAIPPCFAALALLLGPRTTGQRLGVLNPLIADAFAEPAPIPVSRRAF